jgi:hypothetical protein
LDASPFVEHPDDISVADALLGRIPGIDPAGFAQVVVTAFHLAGLDFAGRCNVVAMGNHPPAEMIGHQQQG